MAYILSQPNNNCKGIIIFKHLEIKFINNLDPNLINELKSNYIIGVYFGFYSKLSKDIEWADFYLAADNLIKITNSCKPRIPLNGFNFISSKEMQSNNISVKKYDFLFIGNSQTRKNLLQFVKSLKVMSELSNDFKVLIINRLGESLENKFYVLQVRKTLASLSTNIRKNITYIESVTVSDPLPKDTIKLFFQQSRYLVITSRSEGAARVVGEASLNNLGVISYSKMLGGTNNHLDLNVDMLFDDFKKLPSILLSALDQRKDLDKYTSSNKNSYLEEHSKDILINNLVNFFQLNKENLESEILPQNLYNAFSSHLNLLESKYSNNQTDEILSYKKMYLFASSLLEEPISKKAIFKCKILDFLSKIKKITNTPKTIVKLILS